MGLRQLMRWTLTSTLTVCGLSPFSLAFPPDKPDQPESKPTAPAPGSPEIKPLPLTPIPDDPPPHEGAMIELPYIVEPPDLITVEVLEALPGRTISGERLVRPDGKISLGFYGDLHVSGLTADQIKVKLIEHLRRFIADEVLGLEDKIAPQESNKVFVDVSSYNSKTFFVQGDVAAPGKLPWTGRETVLDALNLSAGFVVTADPKNIRLVRPARGGKPTKIYTVDFEAIRDKGDTKANYQLFPGDRLIVYRSEIAAKTAEIDRLAGALQTVTNSILQYTFMTRYLAQATSSTTPGGPALTPEQREQIMKDWVDFWWKAVSKPGGVELDERTFREGLLRHLNPPQAPAEAKEKE
jgi:polysaccharide export outer membrane protein